MFLASKWQATDKHTEKRLGKPLLTLHGHPHMFGGACMTLGIHEQASYPTTTGNDAHACRGAGKTLCDARDGPAAMT